MVTQEFGEIMKNSIYWVNTKSNDLISNLLYKSDTIKSIFLGHRPFAILCSVSRSLNIIQPKYLSL
mgnify:CR=1 FL=1